MKHSAGRQPYLDRVQEVLRGVPASAVVQVFVEHAPACRKTRGGDCTCRPSMTVIMPDGKRASIDARGAVADAVGVS